MPVTRIINAPSWLIARSNSRAQRILVDAFDQFGLRPLQYRALAALDEHGDLSQAELGRHLGLDRKDVAVTVDVLAQRGLIERSVDKGDRRRRIVSLSAAGHELIPRLHETLSGAQRAILAPLTKPEATALVTLLNKLTGEKQPARDRTDEPHPPA